MNARRSYFAGAGVVLSFAAAAVVAVIVLGSLIAFRGVPIGPAAPDTEAVRADPVDIGGGSVTAIAPPGRARGGAGAGSGDAGSGRLRRRALPTG